MCLICIDFDRGSLKPKEARRALREMRTQMDPAHAREVEQKLDQAEAEALFVLGLARHDKGLLEQRTGGGQFVAVAVVESCDRESVREAPQIARLSRLSRSLLEQRQRVRVPHAATLGRHGPTVE